MNPDRKTLCQSIWFPKILILLVLLLTALAPASKALAQAGSDMPLQFKMIGKFYDPDKDKDAGGVNRFTVDILEKTWIFDIDSSQTLQGGALGSTVLKKIYPPIMTFMGAKEITDQLTDPAIEGRTYTLTGQLYIGKRLFRLTQVQEGPAEESEGHAEAASGSETGANDASTP